MTNDDKSLDTHIDTYQKYVDGLSKYLDRASEMPANVADVDASNVSNTDLDISDTETTARLEEALLQALTVRDTIETALYDGQRPDGSHVQRLITTDNNLYHYMQQAVKKPGINPEEWRYIYPEIPQTH